MAAMTSHRAPRISAALYCIFLLLLLSGCSFSSIHRSVDVSHPGYQGKEKLLVDETQARLGCGLDAVLASARYFGLDKDGEVLLSPAMREHLSDGSTPVELLLGAREAGLGARVVRATPEELEIYAADDAVVPVIMMNAALTPQELLRLKKLGIPFLPDPSPVDQPHWLLVAGVVRQDDGPSKYVVVGSESKQYALTHEILVPRWEKYDYCTILLSRPEEAAK